MLNPFHQSRLQTVVELREKGMTFTELAKMFNVTPARTRQIYLEAIKPKRPKTLMNHQEFTILMNLRAIAIKCRLINYLHDYVAH